MSLASLITDLTTRIFGADMPKLAKNTPKNNETIPNEYILDLEAGEGEFYRRLKQKQLELYSKPKDWDLEKSDLMAMRNVKL